MISTLFRRTGEATENCYTIESSRPLHADELVRLRWLLAETFEQQLMSDDSFLSGENCVLEFGPRLNFETAASTNAVAVCHACGLPSITRLECSRRHIFNSEEGRDEFIAAHHDRMTECLYDGRLVNFETGLRPASVFTVPVLTQGTTALAEVNTQMGLGMDAWDIQYYTNMFTNDVGRDPTSVECFQLGQANSEHSRHWFFKGRIVINGKEMPLTLIEVVQSTLAANPGNSVIAFNDNSSAITGYEVITFVPVSPGKPSAFEQRRVVYNITFTAETHNFPTGIAPVPGAKTGTGGRIRDGHATGRGGLIIAGTAGYCVGNLYISGYTIAGEIAGWQYPDNMARPLQILIDASNGASDYGNEFGEPLIQGFCRAGGLVMPDGSRREWIKPIMFSGGVGQMDARHTKKAKPAEGMRIIRIGGKAYRIGVGGGGASSMIQGASTAELDFNAVQRGNAEMENKVNRVIRMCIEMGVNNPIRSIHDQGAGGLCNVLTELVEPVGGRIDVRKISVGDKTLSVLEIWGAEFQESDGLLIDESRLPELRDICRREKVPCDDVGQVTSDGRIVLHDSQDDSNPVDLDLSLILGKLPQKRFEFKIQERRFDPIGLPKDLTVLDALKMVFRQVSVGSKEFLTRKVDRSVTGLIAQQQCCGPVQLPVVDVAVVAQSHFGLTGAATAIGEQPFKMLLDEAAGARMSVGEMLTNMVWALISDITDIKCSGNWMWAAKLDDEGALIYRAAVACADMMKELGIAIDGGKDSLSMAAIVGDKTIKAPGELVVSGYVTVPDITQVVTPDLKSPGQSKLMLIELESGVHRLGGSALALAHGSLGTESPDVGNPQQLADAFNAIQHMIRRGLILSGHDRSDGGLITCLSEMAFAGDCGLDIKLYDEHLLSFGDSLSLLFSEELGFVIEYVPENQKAIRDILRRFNLHGCGHVIGETVRADSIKFSHNGKMVFEERMTVLRELWRETSFQLDALQANPATVAEERLNTRDYALPVSALPFRPWPTRKNILDLKTKPKVAILREEGTNGDREMTSAFVLAGFECWDVTMSDLIGGRVSLRDFKGVAFPGGFSYADVLDAAKGWAGVMMFNPRIADEFAVFTARTDTFVFGVCNGDQFMVLLGLVPLPDIDVKIRPRFIQNESGIFESRFSMVTIGESDSFWLDGMAGSTLGIWVAHGEGRFHCPDESMIKQICDEGLAPIRYVDAQGSTPRYPFNPNGSPHGIAGLTSPDGRFLAMMPHPERLIKLWQWPYMPEEWKRFKASPWLRLFQNAYNWVSSN